MFPSPAANDIVHMSVSMCVSHVQQVWNKQNWLLMLEFGSVVVTSIYCTYTLNLLLTTTLLQEQWETKCEVNGEEVRDSKKWRAKSVNREWYENQKKKLLYIQVDL